MEEERFKEILKQELLAHEKRNRAALRKAVHEEILSLIQSQEFGQLVLNVVNSAVSREMNMEKGPRKQGDPEKVIVRETVNVISLLADYIPRVEASMRGMQADVDLAKTNIHLNNDQLSLMVGILLGLENPLKTICGFADQVRILAERHNSGMIGEGTGEKP